MRHYIIFECTVYMYVVLWVNEAVSNCLFNQTVEQLHFEKCVCVFY